MESSGMDPMEEWRLGDWVIESLNPSIAESLTDTARAEFREAVW